MVHSECRVELVESSHKIGAGWLSWSQKQGSYLKSLSVQMEELQDTPKCSPAFTAVSKVVMYLT